MAERGFTESTDSRAIGYCPVCKRPFKWHKNQLDFSKALGVMPMWKCRQGHDNRVTDKACLTCNEKPFETACEFKDGSRPGFAWGMASRKPARAYSTGARVENERCGYINPDYPGYPCLKPRGHDEDSKFGCQHAHGEVPYKPPARELFPNYKKNAAGIYVEG